MWKFLQILCTALAFYGGYKTSLSHTAAHPPRVHCPVPGDKGAKGLMSLRGQHGAVSIQQSSAEAQPCEALESHTTAATTASAAAAASSSTHKKEGDKKSICDLGNSDKDKQEAAQILSRRTYLHAWKGDIAAGAFAHLHNPASPAKYSLVLTASNSWEADTQWALPAAAAAAAAAGGSASTMIGANNVNISHADAELFKDPYFSHECKSLYLTRTGSRQSQPNKCVAVARVKPGYESPTQSSHRIGYTALLTNQYQADFTKDKAIIEENMLLPPLLKDLQNLKTALLKKLGPPIDASTGKRRTAIVMVANEGVMDLVLNWACSSEAAGVSLDDVVVFVGTEDSAAAVENMGAHAMYSSALGSMPKKAAGGYLDNTFSRMMWFKTTSVYLAMYSGFHVLFQDADLVWLKNPIPYLESHNADVAFMDDGARTPRYTPFFVNSGFYYLKYNAKSLYFQEQMLKSGPSEIGYVPEAPPSPAFLPAFFVSVYFFSFLLSHLLKELTSIHPSLPPPYLANVQNHTFTPKCADQAFGGVAPSVWADSTATRPRSVPIRPSLPRKKAIYKENSG